MATEAFLFSVEKSKNNQFNHPSLNIMTSYVYVTYLFKVQNYFVTKYTRACRLVRLLLSQRRVFIDREAHVSPKRHFRAILFNWEHLFFHGQKSLNIILICIKKKKNLIFLELTIRNLPV